MVFLSIGSAKSIQFEYKDINKASQNSMSRTIPIFFPFAFIFFIFQNYRILLAPSKLSKVIVLKIVLINIFQIRFQPSIVALFKMLFMHILIIPRDSSFPIQLREFGSNQEIWVSRHATVQGFTGGRFISELEDDLKRSFFSRTIQLWGRIANERSDARIDYLHIKSKIELLRVGQSDQIVDGAIYFRDLSNAFVVNGSYVISENQHVKTLPYEVGGMSSFPQREVLGMQDQIFQQRGMLKGNQQSGLFLGYSNNWYHFVVEVLPRGILWSQESKQELGVVFNRDIPETIYEIIKRLGRKEPTLISDGETVNFKNLSVAIDGRHPHQADMHRIKPNYNIFTNRIIDFHLIQSWMKENFKWEEGSSPKRVFLVRGPGNSRPLKNASQVQSALEMSGFVAVNPGSLSIERQIHLFENAEIMVAEGGAALTNLIFAVKMKHLIHIEANPHPQVAGFWQQFAEALKIDVSCCFGVPDTSYRNFNNAYTINVDSLLRQLKAIC